MRNLVINRIQYNIKTTMDSVYGADIPFHSGLNVIYGPNSLGKTSIITGIIYALGAEKGLGIFKADQNPFKPEFYDRINGENIKTSYVLLEISNGIDTYCIARGIKNKTNTVAIKKCTIDNVENTKETKYLVASGDGVFAEDGLQFFLFNFLDIPIVEVPTYESKLSKLYLENLVPLFFVEQRAGWSQIQARQVTRYGIREIKKVAFEFIMGLDRFQMHLIEIKRREIQEEIRRKKTIYEDAVEQLLVAANAKVVDDTLIVEKEGLGKISVFEIVTYLTNRYNIEIERLDKLEDSDMDVKNDNHLIRENLKKAEFFQRKTSDRINKLVLEINGYVSYIERIQQNKFKNKQLKKIEGLSLELNITYCPICETPLNREHEGECILCHHDIKRKISTPEQNLEFLEDEEKSFRDVLESKQLELRKQRVIHSENKEKIGSLEQTLEHQISTFIGGNTNSLRAKVQELDLLNQEIKKFTWIAKKWKELDASRLVLKNLNIENAKLAELVKGFLSSPHDVDILNSIKMFFQKNVKSLNLFKGKEELISKIKIDELDYSPFLEEYDIFNIISSSDNVRIMLSYYLSLLQTSLLKKDDNEIKFPNLLLFDEPKQQNLDNDSLIEFVKVIESLSSNSFQIILTTYLHQPGKDTVFKDYIRHEMLNTTDYLLKKIG
jgi:hypothetical protein